MRLFRCPANRYTTLAVLLCFGLVLSLPNAFAEDTLSSLKRLELRLEEERIVIEKDRKSLNADCANVRSTDTAKVQECQRRFQDVRSRMLKYKADLDALSKRRKNFIGTGIVVPGIVHKEQDEYEKRNKEWLSKQHKLIRESIEKNRKWTNEVLTAIQEIRVPKPAYRPKTFSDLQPGDILLLSPGEGSSGRSSRLIRMVDNFTSRRDFQTPASHALTYLGRSASGGMLFLNNTPVRGTHIMGETEFHLEYSKREVYIARVQAKVDGRKLFMAALKAALEAKKDKVLGSDYGLIGEDAVCSETAAIAVAKATGVDFENKKRWWNPVDITPGDFFDKESVGKYFIISPLDSKP